MKKITLILIAFMFVIIGFSQIWEKYDGSTVDLKADLTLKNQPASMNYKIISPFLYRSQEVLNICIDEGDLIITHKGLIKGFEWQGVIVYRKIYGIVKGKIELIKVVDGKYTAPVTIPEKRQFKKVLIIL